MQLLSLGVVLPQVPGWRPLRDRRPVERHSRLKSLLYASVSALAADEQDEEIARIAAVSKARNAELGVTGTLVLARGRFAQILEGEAEAVDTLMAAIGRDPRHSQVTIAHVATAPRAVFAGWSLSYAGSSYYVEKHITPLLDGPDPIAARELRQLMRALADTA